MLPTPPSQSHDSLIGPLTARSGLAASVSLRVPCRCDSSAGHGGGSGSEQVLPSSTTKSPARVSPAGLETVVNAACRSLSRRHRPSPERIPRLSLAHSQSPSVSQWYALTLLLPPFVFLAGPEWILDPLSPFFFSPLPFFLSPASPLSRLPLILSISLLP